MNNTQCAALYAKEGETLVAKGAKEGASCFQAKNQKKADIKNLTGFLLSTYQYLLND